MYNIRPHFDELILECIVATRKQAARRAKPSRNDYNLVRNVVTVTTT